ncbi:tetratricopeptide repeat protein 31-like protein, partial [Leptotrombidium deliense]
RKFEEAEAAFNKVLELEKIDRSEATSELIRIREEAVRQLGYDKQSASAAAAKYNSVHEAIDSVVNCMFNVTRQHNDECDSEDELILNANLNYPSIADKTPNDVTNPFGWKALWVGNLSQNADEAVLQRMFCKYGVLSHCGLYKRPEGAFALVHYDNSESPRRAMAAYQVLILRTNGGCIVIFFQGTVIKGISLGDSQKLILRFRPNRDQKQDKYQERIDTPECYYWRTTGCLRVEDCHYLHIPANKGVDIQPWMITSDGKPRNPNQRITKK